MHLSILATLLVAVTSSLGAHLHPRGGCSLKTKTTKVGGTTATLTGPFALKASASSAVGGNCAYGQAGAKFIFDIPKDKASTATDWYLEKNGHLVMIDGGKLYTVFEKDASDKGFVEIGTSTSTNMICSIDESSCALKCKASGFSYNCLASPLDKPDWRIAKDAAVAAQNCVPFTPKIVPK